MKKQSICVVMMLLTGILVGCGGPGVQKIGENLYSVSEKSQPTQAAAEHIPDPAIDDIKDAAKNYCGQDNRKVKVVSYDQPQDPTIRQDMYRMKFSCVIDQN